MPTHVRASTERTRCKRTTPPKPKSRPPNRPRRSSREGSAPPRPSRPKSATGASSAGHARSCTSRGAPECC
ncbi:MAG: hypothetical protein F4106_11540 [Gemmatimonadetes bacterium]|nr:hypothetical protein [Gemmatimonadota bacterium]MXX72056.1 hypothetical protein [Gemmatimonadota bacterium]MYC91603.1 hypothetical protein [Gemmatimonadota bacterium]MYG35782.1 hypothetical protein [Gemmatimonadota bacterium]MYJ18646.1 hypothetical protein [Gemmatimonadota bacterium]